MRTAKELVPGDPAAIWQLADSYNRMARRCEDASVRLRSVDDGGWRGRAADAFRARIERQPRRMLAMADSYGQVAVALDTYACALAWAQRQAGALIASRSGAEPPTVRPALTVTQQARLTGVITGHDEPETSRGDERELAACTYRRALALVESVGNDSATAITAAAELMTPPAPEQAPAVAVEPAASAGGGPVPRTVIPPAKPWFDPSALRDDMADWETAIRQLRKRLRWDGLDRLSPRLAQHIFDGHYRPSKNRCTGYHHREGGVDNGALRVVRVVSGPDSLGVYKAQVRGPHIPSRMTKTSMFFPDSWSRAEVLHGVRQAFFDALRSGNYDSARRRFTGTYQGVLIEGHLKHGPAVPRLCDIVTAYPRGMRKQ